ncbi:hypothetical protein F8A10_17960 [Paracoccus kondratievae]|nr:hypothetical protein F8A10_17960 [Paracoccus kondratievae]
MQPTTDKPRRPDRFLYRDIRNEYCLLYLRHVHRMCWQPGEGMARTADNGLQPLHWVGLVKLGPAELAASPKLHPLRIRAGALANGTPGPDLMVSPQPPGAQAGQPPYSAPLSCDVLIATVRNANRVTATTVTLLFSCLSSVRLRRSPHWRRYADDPARPAPTRPQRSDHLQRERRHSPAPR